MFLKDKLPELDEPLAKRSLEVKAPDPFTLESLIAWLEKRPADGTYNWHDCSGACLISLYGAAHGEMDYCTARAKFIKGAIWAPGIAMRQPWTFGAALERARQHGGNRDHLCLGRLPARGPAYQANAQSAERL